MTTLIPITILAGIVLATIAGEMVQPAAEANATALRPLWLRTRPKFRIGSRRMLLGCATAFGRQLRIARDSIMLEAA